MDKIKNILRSIRIEEYILFIFSIMLFLSCLIFSPQLSWLDSFRNGFGNVILGIKYFLIVFVLSFGVIVGIVGGVYPSWQASRVAPMETLRNE